MSCAELCTTRFLIIENIIKLAKIDMEKYEFCALVYLLMSMWTCSFKTYCYNK